MSRSTLRYSFLLVMLSAWCGCEHDCYEIEMKPEGDGFQRQLACWHEGGKDGKEISPLSAGKRAAIARAYPQGETPGDGKKQSFTGRFGGKTPSDVGGAGSYTCYTTPLGSTSAYIERFRGNDGLEAQLDKQLAKRHEAADQLADLVAGWLTAELGEEPKFARLKKFLDNDLRRDLRNLAVYMLTFQLAGERASPPNCEFLVRAGQYFCERGYLSPQEVPMLIRALSGNDMKPLLSHVQRFLARKMGIADDQPLPASLGFMDTLTGLSASCEKYVRSTELFRKRHEAQKSQKEDQKKKGSTEGADEGNQLVLELALEVIGFQLNLFSENDSLRVKLSSGEKPYATNGEWDEKAATVAWSGGVGTDTEDQSLPVVCFALWSTPDSAFQGMRFGKILLAKSSLAEYAIWYRALEPEEAREWDQFLASLKPGPDLAAGVKAFRFSSDPKADQNKPGEQPSSLADTPRRLILEALEGKPGGTK